MSVQTLYTAATGMESLQTKLDTVAHNLANVNTVGFKRMRANFEDNFYRQEVYPGTLDGSGKLTPTGTAVGLGSHVSSTQTDFNQGAFQQTGRELDVAIEGKGFFQVADPNGTILYSRAGNFSLNADNQLVMGSAGIGRLVEPPVQFPNNTTNIVFQPNGNVMAKQFGQQQLTQVTQLQLAQFVNPEGLLKLGENLYAATDASQTAQIAAPGQNGLGLVRQNMLEASNVEPVQELIDLITTQRSFELNSQAVQAGDEVLQLISNLRR